MRKKKEETKEDAVGQSALELEVDPLFCSEKCDKEFVMGEQI